MEFSSFLIDVILVNLVSDDQNVVLVANVDDFLDVALRQDLAGRVARVDDDDASEINTLLFGHLDLLLNISSVERPVLRLI